MGFSEEIGKSLGIAPATQVVDGGDLIYDTEIGKSKTWPQVHSLLTNLQQVPQSGDYKNYLKVFTTMVWVYTCVWCIATSLASRPLRLYKGKPGKSKEIEDGELYDLFQRPNPLESGGDLVEALVMGLELTGNGYVEKFGLIGTPGAGRLPAKLFSLDSGCMTIIPDPKYKVAGYEYDIGGAGSPDTFSSEEVVHIKYTNPADQFYGQGPIAPLVTTLITELYREAYQKTYFENEARPDVILKQHVDISKGMMPLARDKSALTAFAREWQYSFGGPKKSRLPVMLPPGMDMDLLSEARRDMDFREMEKSLRERVMAGLNVPPVLAGLTDSVNYANAKEQNKLFWTVTMPPKGLKVSQALTRGILRPYDPEVYCEFDFRDIPALEEDIESKRTGVAKLHSQGLIDFGEAREALGYDAPGDDPNMRKKVIAVGFVDLEDVIGDLPTEEGERRTEDDKTPNREESGTEGERAEREQEEIGEED